MLKNKWVFLVLLFLAISLSSCGIFHKGCGCPEFGKTREFKNLKMC
jgi:hypothetical protein